MTKTGADLQIQTNLFCKAKHQLRTDTERYAELQRRVIALQTQTTSSNDDDDDDEKSSFFDWTHSHAVVLRPHGPIIPLN